MYAVICSNVFYEEIEMAVNSIDGNVIFKSVGKDLLPDSEFSKLRTAPFKTLIVDVSCFLNNSNIIFLLKQLRLSRDDLRLIIIASNLLPGDKFFAGLVNLGIYDIIVPDSDEFILLPCLIDVLLKPMVYKDAIRLVETKVNEDNQSKFHSITQKEKIIEIEKEKIIGPVTIGVAGVLKRIGTTYTALSIASFLSDNYKVAVLEIGGDSPVLLHIQNSYDVEMNKDKSFMFKNIHYFPFQRDFNMSSLMNFEFDYIIFDLGVYESCNKNEFWRSNLRIMVCGSRVWELAPLELFFKENQRNDNVNYIFSFTDDSTFKDISKAISPLKCFQAPYNPTSFVLIDSQKELYLDLLEEVIPKCNNRKKRGLFKMLKRK